MKINILTIKYIKYKIIKMQITLQIDAFPSRPIFPPNMACQMNANTEMDPFSIRRVYNGTVK